MDRELFNRWDKKWAHPDIVEDGWYTTDMMTDPHDLRKMTAEQVEEQRGSMKKLIGGMITDLEKWMECYTVHGCPEEPDAPKVRMMLQMPERKKEGEKFPVVLTISGGGLTGGAIAEIGALNGKAIVDNSGERVVRICFDYRIAPANPYPAAVNDCHAVYQWVVEHAEELHVDLDKIVITGGSTGGHLALCLVARLKRYHWCNGILPRGLILMVPAVNDVDFTMSARYSFVNPNTGKVEDWDHDCVENSFRLWLGERYGDIRLPAEAVPNRLTPEDVKGFPPVWIPAEAEFEPGRDFIYRLAAMLHEAGVFCDIHVWGATGHQLYNGGKSDLSKRIQQISSGALRDAIRYDFRRTWLDK